MYLTIPNINVHYLNLTLTYVTLNPPNLNIPNQNSSYLDEPSQTFFSPKIKGILRKVHVLSKDPRKMAGKVEKNKHLILTYMLTL